MTMGNCIRMPRELDQVHLMLKLTIPLCLWWVPKRCSASWTLLYGHGTRMCQLLMVVGGVQAWGIAVTSTHHGCCEEEVEAGPGALHDLLTHLYGISVTYHYVYRYVGFSLQPHEVSVNGRLITGVCSTSLFATREVSQCVSGDWCFFKCNSTTTDPQTTGVPPQTTSFSSQTQSKIYIVYTIWALVAVCACVEVRNCTRYLSCLCTSST